MTQVRSRALPRSINCALPGSGSLFQFFFFRLDDFLGRAIARFDGAVHETGEVAAGVFAGEDEPAIQLRGRGGRRAASCIGRPAGRCNCRE